MGRPATHPRRGPTEWATVVPTVRTDGRICMHTHGFVYAYARTCQRSYVHTYARTCIHTIHAYKFV
jgi:hypothetical protein